MTRTHAKGPGESKLVRDLPSDKQRGFAVQAKKTDLTAEEEKVLRMRRGIAAPPDQPLEFQGGDNDLTRKRLADMERDNLRRHAKNEQDKKGHPPAHQPPLKLIRPDLA